MNALVINCSPVKHGATAEIVSLVHNALESKYEVKSICIDDYEIEYCRGCRTCHTTAICKIDDDVCVIMREFAWADLIVCVSPSYWADIPGQFKAFIDRCTPWCDTHDPHASIGNGKKGYAIALRTGQSMRECNRIIESIEHFYGHLRIVPSGNMGLCSVEYKEDVAGRINEIQQFCDSI